MAPLAPGLERERARVALERRLRRRHAAAVARAPRARPPCTSATGTLPPGRISGPEPLHHRDDRVGADADRGEVALRRGLEQRLLHLGAVREGVHDDVERTARRSRRSGARRRPSMREVAVLAVALRSRAARPARRRACRSRRRAGRCARTRACAPSDSRSDCVELAALEHRLEDAERRRPGADARRRRRPRRAPWRSRSRSRRRRRRRRRARACRGDRW